MPWQDYKPFSPRKAYQWPDEATDLSAKKVIELYANGHAGAVYDPAAREELYSSLPYPDGEQAAYDFGLVGSGAGKLSIPFLSAYRHWPKCWPCPGQETGCCVSRAGKNSAIILIGVECDLAQPDPVTGVVEGWPEVSAEGESQGVVCPEPLYGYRGHRGQGASCDRLIKYVTSVGGILLRQNYPDLGIDLTKLNTKLGIGWGGSGTPAAVNEEGKKHQIHTATGCPNHEVVRDFIANGYPMWACSGLGWSSKRDENGFSVKSGRWFHSWIGGGYDDRDIIKQKYGFPLFLFGHDWGKWNGGGRRILGTDIDIPEGFFWGDARLLDKCECAAMSNINGWLARGLPDYGFDWS